MQKLSRDALAREQLNLARGSAAARSSTTVFGGHEHALRQTVVALAANASLGEHENPGEATLYVLTGRVRLVAGADAWEGRTGDMLIVPDARHTLEAVEDAVILLTACCAATSAESVAAQSRLRSNDFAATVVGSR